MSVIYNAEAERQSLLATFPRFRDIEKKHGSLIRGMLAARNSRGGTHTPASANSANSSAPKAATSMFVSLRGGTHELVEAVVASLTGDLRLNTGVERITRRDQAPHYQLHLTDGSVVNAEAVLLATPAYVSADLLRDITPGAADLLASIRYVSTGTISFGFRRSEVHHPLNGFGVVIPRSEKRPINAITWSSTKFDHRAPDNHVLLRVFFGGSRNPEMVNRSDEDLIAIARSELRQLLGIDAEPVMHRLYRWRNATPQYDVGHLERVAAIEAALPTGLYVTGSPYRGIGIPDCVHQGQQSAERIWKQIAAETAAEKVTETTTETASP
jgi:oxygen-dependent protoporphyrinogen oxidase